MDSMRYVVGVVAVVVFFIWDAARNDGAWLGYAAAEIDRAAYHLGF